MAVIARPTARVIVVGAKCVTLTLELRSGHNHVHTRKPVTGCSSRFVYSIHLLVYGRPASIKRPPPEVRNILNRPSKPVTDLVNRSLNRPDTLVSGRLIKKKNRLTGANKKKRFQPVTGFPAVSNKTGQRKLCWLTQRIKATYTKKKRTSRNHDRFQLAQ